MKTLDYLHLNEQEVTPVVNALQQLLADFQVYYTNLRGFHWEITGHAFFALHAKFEELYDDVADKVDEIAERILQLGGVPVNKFSEYLKTAKVKEVSGVSCGADAIEHILETFSLLISEERALLKLASAASDEVTVALMSDYLKGQEKLVWMLTAWSTKCKCDEKGCDKK
jgi:starvation-inducible DNA-binding protein